MMDGRERQRSGSPDSQLPEVPRGGEEEGHLMKLLCRILGHKPKRRVFPYLQGLTSDDVASWTECGRCGRTLDSPFS